MSHQKIMSVGAAIPEERDDYAKMYNLRPANNFLISYPKYTLKGEKVAALEKRTVVFSDINPLFEVAVKHTIIGIPFSNSSRVI